MAQPNQYQIQGQVQPPNLTTNRITFQNGVPLGVVPVQHSSAGLGQMRVNVVGQPGANSGTIGPNAIDLINYPQGSSFTNKPVVPMMVSPAANTTAAPHMMISRTAPRPSNQTNNMSGGVVVPHMVMMSHGLNQVVIAPKTNMSPKTIQAHPLNPMPVNVTTRPAAVAVPMTMASTAPRPAPVPVATPVPASPKQHVVNLNTIPPHLWPQFQQQIMRQLGSTQLNTPEEIAKFSQGYKEFLTQSYHMSAGKPKLPASPVPQGVSGAIPAKYVLASSMVANISVDTSTKADVTPSTNAATSEGVEVDKVAEDKAAADKKEKKKRVGLEWTLREKVQLKKTIARWGTTFNEQVSYLPGRNASSLRNYYRVLGGAKGYYKASLNAHYRLKKTNQLEAFVVALTPEEEAAIERDEDIPVVPEETEPQSNTNKIEEEDDDKSESDTSEREIKVEDPYAGLSEEQKREKMKERAELILQANKRGVYWGNALDNANATDPDRKRKSVGAADDTVPKKRKLPFKPETPRTPGEKLASVDSPSQVVENEKKVFSFGDTLPHRSQEYCVSRASSLTGSMRFKAPKFIAAPKQAAKPAAKQPPGSLFKKSVNLNELKRSPVPDKPQSVQQKQNPAKALPAGVKIARTEDSKKLKTILQESFVALLHKQPELALDQLSLPSNMCTAIIEKGVITGIIRHETEKEEEDRIVPYQAIEACKLKFKLDSTKQITSCLVRDRSGPSQWHESTLLPIDSVIALSSFDPSIIAVGSKHEVNIYEVTESSEGKQATKLVGHSSKITALQFSAKGHLASADESGMIRVWQYQQLRRPKLGQNKQLVTQLTSAYQSLKDTNSVNQLHWSLHGEILLSVSNAVVKVWDMLTGSIRPKYAIEVPSRVSSLCLKPKTAEERATRWLVVAPATTAEMQGLEQSHVLLYDMIRDRTSPIKFELCNMLEVTSVVFNTAAPKFCYVLQASGTAKPQLSVVSIAFPADTAVLPAQPAKPVATLVQRYEYAPMHESFVLVGADRADDSMEDVASTTFTSGQLSVNTNGNLLVVTLTSEVGDSKAIVFSLIENSRLEAIYT